MVPTWDGREARARDDAFSPFKGHGQSNESLEASGRNECGIREMYAGIPLAFVFLAWREFRWGGFLFVLFGSVFVLLHIYENWICESRS